MRFYTLFGFFLLSLAAAGQPKSQASRPSVLLTVNDNSVTTEEFAFLFRKNHPRKEDYTEDGIEKYLDLLITFKAKVEEAEARGYDTTRNFRKEFAGYRAELMKPYTADRDQLSQLTRQAYERMTVEVRASHVLVSLKANPSPEDTLAAYNKTLSYRDRILKGEDFSSVARAFSEDPSAKVNGGDLGYFTVLQMVYPFEEAAYQLKTGELSMPVRTRFGYHLIRVTDKRMARGEVEVSHIILRTGNGDDARVKAKIFEIHTELQAGRSWDELCKEYSDDASTKNSGGKLRPFGVGALSGVPEFEQVAFSLHQPGDVSDPFKSAYGWHIVRLERRIPVPAFEQVEESLKRRVSRDERLRMADDKALKRQLEAAGYAEQPDVKEQLLALADSSLLKASWRYRGSPELRSRTLFFLKGKPYSVDQFVRFAREEQQQQVAQPRAAMEQLVNHFVKSSLEDLDDLAIREAHPEYRNLVNEYREGMLLFTIMEEEVWNKASEDTAALRVYYQGHQAAYQSGERVRATVLSSNDSAFVQAMLHKMQRGDSLTRAEVRKFKSVQGPRNFAPGENKAVDRAPRAIGIHQVRVEENYHLVQVESLVAAGIRSLEEVRSQVISDYQDYLEKEWVKKLRSKYPAKVNSKARKSVIRELTQSK
ncbi:MAG: peptidylprolyl isomerase [Cyclobacteriaceae bacterium]|nr:peptidylprolyl isomerase [Cyclobacteriaceae bacterium]